MDVIREEHKRDSIISSDDYYEESSSSDGSSSDLESALEKIEELQKLEKKMPIESVINIDETCPKRLSVQMPFKMS